MSWGFTETFRCASVDKGDGAFLGIYNGDGTQHGICKSARFTAVCHFANVHRIFHQAHISTLIFPDSCFSHDPSSFSKHGSITCWVPQTQGDRPVSSYEAMLLTVLHCASFSSLRSILLSCSFFRFIALHCASECFSMLHRHY